VPDLTHDTAEDGFHEIQLSGKQLVFLFMVTTVILVVTFLSGVLVGRAVGSDDRVDDATVAALEEPAAADAPAPDGPPPPPVQDDFTYHNKLQETKPKEEPKLPATVPETAPPEPPAPAPEAAVIDVPTSGRRGTWFLQVSALSNQSAAADSVRRLVSKGYPAYLENPAPGTPAIYRVRIGRYADRGEADDVARRLLKEEQMTSDVRRQ
jgi:DedD protein